MPTKTIALTIAQVNGYIDLFERIAAQPVLPGDDLSADTRQLSLERLALNISEATTRIPETEKAKVPSIPWRDIIDMGNKLRHDYDNVAASVVDELLTKGHLRALKEALDQLDPDAEQVRKYRRRPAAEA